MRTGLAVAAKSERLVGGGGERETVTVTVTLSLVSGEPVCN